MGGNFGDLDVSRVIYLVLYLLLVIIGLRGMPSTVRRRAEPPRCKACQTPVESDAAPRGPWGGWTCLACGEGVDPVAEPAPRTGLRGWMDQHPWALHGAIWAGLVWILLAARDWWLHEPSPSLLTFPLTLVAGLGIGWVLTLTMGRRA
jgi:hypothetical protein